MKKLIAIAAVALASVSFAADCNTCNTCTTCGDNCGWGYKLKVLVKTTATKSATKVINTCNTCNTGCTTCPGSCYRKPVTKKFLGYIFGRTTGTACTGCGCNNWTNFNFVLWNYAAKKTPVQIRGIELQQFNRFGESVGSMAELAFALTGKVGGYEKGELTDDFNLQFAGFGNIGERSNGTKAIKSISGFCAGILPCYCYEQTKDACGIVTDTTNRLSTVWTICGQQYYSRTTAAYGKWVLAWDSPIVNAITAGKIVFEKAAADVNEDTDKNPFRADYGFTPAGFEKGWRFYAEGFKVNSIYGVEAYCSAKYDGAPGEAYVGGDEEDANGEAEVSYSIADYLFSEESPVE